jgi:hypothetical protein
MKATIENITPEQLAKLLKAIEENERLRAVIKDAPHIAGCPATYDKHAPEWMTPGQCNCWKRKALEDK